MYLIHTDRNGSALYDHYLSWPLNHGISVRLLLDPESLLLRPPLERQECSRLLDIGRITHECFWQLSCNLGRCLSAGHHVCYGAQVPDAHAQPGEAIVAFRLDNNLA